MSVLDLSPTAQYWFGWAIIGLVAAFTAYWILRWAIRHEAQRDRRYDTRPRF